jgi:NTE family protein
VLFRSDLVRLYLGDVRLEDLPIPILVACEDLKSKREIRLAEGDFITVLEASYALPVFFPPVVYGDHLLIDGGITNLVPLRIAMDYSKTVIVSSTFYDAKGLNLRNPLIVLNTSVDIGKRRAGVVDLRGYPEAIWIRCDVESFSFMAFDRLAELADLGFRSADKVAVRLAALDSGGIDPALAVLRAGYDSAIEVAGKTWAPFLRAPAKDPAVTLGARIRSTAFPGDAYHLKDSLFMGGSIGFRWGSLELGLDGGADWFAYTDGTLVPSVVASGTLDILPRLRIAVLASADWPDGHDGGLPLLYQRSAVTAVFPWTAGRVELSSGLELDRIGLDGQALLVSSGAKLQLDGGGRLREISFGAGHQFDGCQDGQFVYADGSLAFLALPSLALRAGGMTRLALDGDGTAPLYLSDPLLIADPSRVDLAGRALAGVALSVGWEPAGATFSFAELLIMRKISLALSGDAAWAGGGVQPVSLVLGVRLGCELALMGLKSSRFRAEAGLDPRSGLLAARLFLMPGSGR